MSDNISIKIKKDDNTWEQIYGNAIANRLRKDQNLADIIDKQEARDNLELSGDNNTTHFHDSRYIPMIENEKNERKAETTQLRTDLDAETANRAKDKEDISKTLVKVQKDVETTVADTKKELSNNMNTLQSNVDVKIDQVNQKLDKADVGKKTITTAGSLHSESATLNQSRDVRDVVTTQCGLGSGGYKYTEVEHSSVKTNIENGTYTIEELLNKLVAVSHEHQVTQCTTYVKNCNCNCCHSSNSH